MKKKLVTLLMALTLSTALLAGCGSSGTTEKTAEKTTNEAASGTFEDYCNENSTIMTAVNALGGDTFKVTVKGNTITYTMPVDGMYSKSLDQTGYQNACASMSESSKSDETVSEMTKGIKGFQDQSGISGLEAEMKYTTQEGDTAYLVTYDENGFVSEEMPLLESGDSTGTDDVDSEKDSSETTGSLPSESDMEMLKTAFTVGLAGSGDDGTKIYWVTDDKMENGMFVMVSTDGEKLSFVGPIESNGDEVTVVDDATSKSLTFTHSKTQDDEGTDCMKITIDDSIGILYGADAAEVIDTIAKLDAQ